MVQLFCLLSTVYFAPDTTPTPPEANAIKAVNVFFKSDCIGKDQTVLLDHRALGGERVKHLKFTPPVNKSQWDLYQAAH